MAKRVVVIASGETERRALPHLAAHLRDQGISIEVRIPPRNRTLNAQSAENLIKAAWYENVAAPPDKFVLLVDLDADDVDAVLEPLKARLQDRLGTEIVATVQYAYARQHLEAWYFGDEPNLTKHLRRALGNVDSSKPDEIQNPKQHLKHLLKSEHNQRYTASVSEQIASAVDAQTIAQRSPSFNGFLEAVLNGSSPVG